MNQMALPLSEAATDWASSARALVEAMNPGELFTAERIEAEIGVAPDRWSSGNVLRNCQASGLIRAVDITAATKATSHGRYLRRWVRT